MKILLINKFLYPKGGDAVCALATGKLLQDKGHQVVYWGMDHALNPDYVYNKYFVKNIDYIKNNSLKKQINSAINILYSFEAKKKIKQVIDQEKPDIVHLHNFAHQISPSILHVFKKHKIPVVMTMHDYKLVCPVYSLLSKGKICEKCKNGKYFYCLLNKCTKGSLLKSLLNTLEMYLHHRILHIYESVDIFICPSKFLKQKVEQMGFKGKLAHLANFVKVDEFAVLNNHSNKEIVYCGRLSEEKGIFTLLQAVGPMDIRLKIIGDGPLKSWLMAEVKQKKFSNVQFTGHLTAEQVKKEISKASLLVIPSECYENNPRSVLEAFALAKPVIGARLGGIPELVIDGKTGLTFSAGDVQDLSKKINQLISSPEKITKFGENAREFIEQEFDQPKHYDQLMRIYQLVLK